MLRPISGCWRKEPARASDGKDDDRLAGSPLASGMAKEGETWERDRSVVTPSCFH